MNAMWWVSFRVATYYGRGADFGAHCHPQETLWLIYTLVERIATSHLGNEKQMAQGRKITLLGEGKKIWV